MPSSTWRPAKPTFTIQVSDVKTRRTQPAITVVIQHHVATQSLQATSPVMYGVAPMVTPPDTTALGAPTDVSVSTLRNTGTVSVVWVKNPNAEQTKVVLFNADVTGLGYLDGLETFNPANDDGSHTFRQVPVGTYWVVVASFRTGERHQLSDLREVTVE